MYYCIEVYYLVLFNKLYDYAEIGGERMNIKNIITSGVTIVGLLATTTIGLPAAMADSTNSAVVIKDSGCGLLDRNGSFTSTTTNQIVDTSSSNSKITCKAQVTPSVTATGAVHWNFANTGIMCSTTFGLTQDWEEVVSPSGQATLQCHINPNPTP
jgi:hypothetical protein